MKPDFMPTVAEFFAGIGLVRMALEREGCRVVFANDISPTKRDIYAANFDASDYACVSIHEISGSDVPDTDIATASFPCTDLSLAGNRNGLAGEQSGLLWEFLRIIDEMGHRKPASLLLENVLGFASSNGGADLCAAVSALNDLGYLCDLISLDAKHFVPQSRPRLFIVASFAPLASPARWLPNEIRNRRIIEFGNKYIGLSLQAADLPSLPSTSETLKEVVERHSPANGIWWDDRRLNAFLSSLSPIQTRRLDTLMASPRLTWASAFRRTRHGTAVWEIRPDSISGCLRTTRGGSSKQALVEAGRGKVRVRWMTAREYARLQGARKLQFGGATESQVQFAAGDAVCVPAVAWLARNYLVPLASGSLTTQLAANG